ncbi:MAG: hypothetical protein IKL97_06025, partial [Eggerthellaceae bacterium]|nr:hypothetical protein [Eggerthellaceae bacterium]
TTTYSGDAVSGFVVTNVYTPGSSDPGTPPDPSAPGGSADDPDDPQLPSTGGNARPEIPQTGNRPLAAYTLIALGLALLATGLVSRMRARGVE